MTTQGTGTYQITGWDEKPYDEQAGEAKLTRANITNTFTGVIEGEGTAELLMAYPDEASATIVGFQKVTGSIEGRKGSFVLQTAGTWVGGVARAEWRVVPGSGVGELAGLTGAGGYVSTAGGACDVTLDYDLA
jgi:Protein of unknown function (DUF3224)